MSNLLSDARVEQIRFEAQGYKNLSSPDLYDPEVYDLARIVLELLADRDETQRELKELAKRIHADVEEIHHGVAKAIGLIEGGTKELKQGRPTQ